MNTYSANQQGDGEGSRIIFGVESWTQLQEKLKEIERTKY